MRRLELTELSHSSVVSITRGPRMRSGSGCPSVENGEPVSRTDIVAKWKWTSRGVGVLMVLLYGMDR